MVDSSWDNQAPLPSKGGGPAWGKLALGCGLTAVVVLSALAVGGIAVANRKMNDPEVKTKLGRTLWPLILDLVEQLKTDEGARAVYAANPRLRDSHPSEEAFLSAVQGWRPSLATMPPSPESKGSFETRVSFQGMRMDVRLGDGRHLLIRVQGQGRHHRLPVSGLEVK